MTDLEKDCSFPPSQGTKVTYTCLPEEVCCPVGCCLPPIRRVNEFWCFWIAVGIGIFILVCIHYYRKLKIAREAHAARRGLRSPDRYMRAYRTPNPPPPTRRNLDNAGAMDDLFFQQLLASFRTRRNAIQSANLPPDYSTVEKELICADLPPDYNEACKMLKDSNAEPPEVVVCPTEVVDMETVTNLDQPTLI